MKKEINKKVSNTIHLCSGACAVIAVQPLPFADIFFLTPIQIAMGARIAVIYGVPVTKSEISLTLKEIAGAIGLGLGAQHVVIGLYKIGLPGIGGFTTIPLVYGLTFAIGKVMDAYFRAKSEGKQIDMSGLKELFEKAFKRGKAAGEKHKQEIIEKSSSVKKPEKIIREQHMFELYEAIRLAEASVIILSGWARSYVVNDKLISALEEAIKRNVSIYIGYGFKDSRNVQQQDDRAKQAEKSLLRLQSRYPQNVFIGKFDCHDKLLIKDEDYYIIGSNNWLSNSGFRNSERSTKSYDKDGLKIHSEDARKQILGSRTR
ncbi:phospholipase D-like domain-containing protein [Candidatus Omnitrophota bacterium]